MIKVENGRLIKDAGKLYVEGVALYKRRKWEEARARLWYSTHMEPALFPAALTLANVRYEHGCIKAGCAWRDDLEGVEFDPAKLEPEDRRDVTQLLRHVYRYRRGTEPGAKTRQASQAKAAKGKGKKKAQQKGKGKGKGKDAPGQPGESGEGQGEEEGTAEGQGQGQRQRRARPARRKRRRARGRRRHSRRARARAKA